MADSCCPANPTAVPAVPTSSTCFDGHSIRKAICLPSSCRSRTWQLVTHQENCKRPNSAPVISEPVSCPSTCFPETSCVGFVCQPIGSHTACSASDTGRTPHPAASLRPSCLESSVCDNSLCHRDSSKAPDCTSGSCQAACAPSGCDDGSCQPSCSEATSCVESPCLPASCEATSCQPTCCQGGSHQRIKGEGQLCKSVYYQLVCYVLEPCQSAPCMAVSCQPLTCVCPCSQICCVPSSCQPLQCQPAPPISFICQPVATCQSPCFVKSSCKSASCAMVSGQPTCGGPMSNYSSCHSPSCQPPCCVTGVGRPSSSDGPSCCTPASPNVCQAGACMPTS